MRTAPLTLTVMLALFPAVGRSDGLIRTLPKDGSWAAFHCDEAFDEGTKRVTYITIKSVGSEAVNGEPCRWIELKYQREAAWPKGDGAVRKLLVPEKHLTAGGDPLTHSVRAWRKDAGEPVAEWTPAADRPRLMLVLAPPVAGVKEVKERQTFDWQKGRLTTERVQVGTAKYTLPAETIRVTYRFAPHPDAPFGVAGAALEIDSSLGYKGTVRFALVDMGTGATSELPDAK